MTIDAERMAAITRLVDERVTLLASPDHGPDRPVNRRIRIVQVEHKIRERACEDFPYLLARLAKYEAFEKAVEREVGIIAHDTPSWVVLTRALAALHTEVK